MGMKGPVFEAREAAANVVRLEKWSYRKEPCITSVNITPSRITHQTWPLGA